MARLISITEEALNSTTHDTAKTKLLGTNFIVATRAEGSKCRIFTKGHGFEGRVDERLVTETQATVVAAMNTANGDVKVLNLPLIGDNETTNFTNRNEGVLIDEILEVVVNADSAGDSDVSIVRYNTKKAIKYVVDDTVANILAAANAGEVQQVEVDLTNANIIGMNGTPVEVVASAGATKVIEFVSATLIYDYDTAAYTGGGDVTIEYSGGAAVSTTITAANSFAAAGDKVFSMMRLNAAGGYTMPVNTGLDITNATGAFVDPGTAAGVGRLIINYRVHETNL